MPPLPDVPKLDQGSGTLLDLKGPSAPRRAIIRMAVHMAVLGMMLSVREPLA